MKWLKKIFCPGPRYSRRKALFIIFGSLIFFSASGGLTLFFGKHAHFLQKRSSHALDVIVQPGPFKTQFLAESLGLACNHTIACYDFDLEIAKNTLLNTHVFKKIELKKIKPNILFIDYEARQPLAQLGNFSNTWIDAEGFLFPRMPFYSPRSLPEIWLDNHLESNPWGIRIDEKTLDKIKKIFALLNEEAIERIDLTYANESTEGRRQIIVLLKDKRLLRLTPKNYAQEIARYLLLEKKVFKNDHALYIVELRIPDVAYIEKRV